MKLLKRLKRKERFYRQFESWPDVIEFMDVSSSEDHCKDDVLRPIFREQGKNGDQRWNVILLVIFWPRLEALYWKKCAWDRDHDERWQTLMCVFYEVVSLINLKKRPDRLAQKVINDTYHRLHDEYRRRWRRMGRERPVEDEELQKRAGCEAGIDFTAIELREAQEAEIKRLKEHMEAGRLKEKDFTLLVSTRIHGQSLADFVRDSGLTYNCAKKRRQRAEAKIRRYEEGE